ncbi:MAG: LLM class flavin-dependent oxidoreductase [Acidimicrobiales bacterium]
MEIGLASLGDVLPDPVTEQLPSDARRHRSIVERCVEAEQLGFDNVHLGEHHGSGYQLSAPPVVLAAVGERTNRIRLSTGVTLVANLDPVRVAEDYATLDCLTGGRGPRSWPARATTSPVPSSLGPGPASFQQLFAEHVQLLVRLLGEEGGDPYGRGPAPAARSLHRPAPAGPDRCRCGSAVARRATPWRWPARLGLPLMLPSGNFAPIEAFAPWPKSCRTAWAEAGHAGRPALQPATPCPG